MNPACSDWTILEYIHEYQNDENQAQKFYDSKAGRVQPSERWKKHKKYFMYTSE
jgi:hypothetical protein